MYVCMKDAIANGFVMKTIMYQQHVISLLCTSDFNALTNVLYERHHFMHLCHFFKTSFRILLMYCKTVE